MTTENQLSPPCDISYSQFSIDTKCSINNESKTGRCQCCRRHCLKGYFWAIIGGICFFIILPTGILLIIHGHFRGIALTLCLGVLVLVVCICVLPGAYIGLHHWRRQRARRQLMRRMALNAVKEQAAFVNDSALINHNEPLRAMEV